MSEERTLPAWSDHILQAQLDAWDAILHSGARVDVALHAAPRYPFPLGAAYVLFVPGGVQVTLTFSQALKVAEWMDLRGGAVKPASAAPRDAQFAGFARMLVDDLRRNADPSNDNRILQEQLIARRAHDLVAHAIETADYSGIKQWLQGENIPLFHKVVQSIPDLTAWPEGDESVV